MFGVDVSSYQRDIDFSQVSPRIDFAIVKLTEGKEMRSESAEILINGALENGLLLGAYHFARPDINNTSSLIRTEAENFCKNLINHKILSKAILVLDWETEPLKHGDLAAVWLETVYKETGVKPLIYASKSTFEASEFRSIGKDYPKWIAYWPSIKIINTPDEFFSVCFPYHDKIDTIGWDIWQFSSRGKIFGYNKTLDVNYTKLTPSEWSYYATSEHKEVISTEMQWAIDNGLFRGYSDGLYRPKEALTREQAAALFYRYNEYLKAGGK